VETQTKSQQRKLNNALQAIKVMLANKKRNLPITEWQGLVEVTKKSIISNPHQYFDTQLPEREHLETMIANIFRRFLDDQSIR
jgi:hypothetical protein